MSVAALAAWNVGWTAPRLAEYPEEREEGRAFYKRTTDAAGGPIRADPDALLDEISANAVAWNYVRLASELKDHAVLLVAATRDAPYENIERQKELAATIRTEGGKRARLVVFEDDHPFSSHSIALAYTLTHWLGTDCSRTQVATSDRK